MKYTYQTLRFTKAARIQEEAMKVQMRARKMMERRATKRWKSSSSLMCCESPSFLEKMTQTLEPARTRMMARPSHFTLKSSFRMNRAISRLKIIVNEELLLNSKMLPYERAIVLHPTPKNMVAKPIIQYFCL